MKNTDSAVNHNIKRLTETRLSYYAANPNEIDSRLEELDREWDIERALETNSSILSLVGLTFGITKAKKWLALPLVVQGFLLQHAIEGWCPPLPILRRLGFRTSDEINYERYALKFMRGDFEHINAKALTAVPEKSPEELLETMSH